MLCAGLPAPGTQEERGVEADPRGHLLEGSQQHT